MCKDVGRSIVRKAQFILILFYFSFLFWQENLQGNCTDNALSHAAYDTFEALATLRFPSIEYTYLQKQVHTSFCPSQKVTVPFLAEARGEKQKREFGTACKIWMVVQSHRHVSAVAYVISNLITARMARDSITTRIIKPV
jgi:hypothetical protein